MTIGAESLGRTVMELSTDSTAFFSDLDKADKRVVDFGKSFDRVAKDVSAFAQNVKSSGQQTAAAGDLIGKAFASAEKGTQGLVDATRQLAGADLISKANNYAAAIEAIGGASKLTAAEQKEVNATVTEAIAKYQALGQSAPDTLHKLASATAQVEKPTTLAAKATDALKSSFVQMTAAFGVANLIERAVSGLISFGAAAFDNAGKMVDLANKSGLTLQTIQQFQHVSAQSGTSVDTLTDSVFKLGTTLSEGKNSARQAVKDLGLEFNTLKNSKPDEAFNSILASLEKMEPGFDRSLAMQRLFGKGAKDVAKLVADGYTDMAKEAKTSSDEQIKALDAAGDAWERFKRDTQTSITSWLGNLVLARETVGKLTGEQMAQYQALLRGGGDAAKFLRDLSVKSAEVTKELSRPIPVDPLVAYRKALGDLRADLVNLTPAQQSVIKEADKLGQSAKEIADGIGVTEDAVRNYVAGLKDLARETKSAATETEKQRKSLNEFLKWAKESDETFRKLGGTMSQLIRDEMIEKGKRAYEVLSKNTDATGLWVKAIVQGIPAVESLSSLLTNIGDKIPVAVKPLKTSFEQARDTADALASSLNQLARTIPGVFGAIIVGAGRALTSFGDLMDATDKYRRAAYNAEKAGESTFKLTAQYAIQASASVLGYAQTAISVIEKLYDSLTGKEKQAALDARGGLHQLQTDAALAGTSFTDTIETAAGFRREMLRLDKVISDNAARMERYHLTWVDLRQDLRQVQIDQFARTLLTDFRAIERQVGSTQATLKTLGPALSDFVVQSIKAGTKIPASLQPILAQLIKARGLTEAAARAMLGLEEDSTPALSDIREAAERYGATLDDLGPKVKQLQINEAAAQIVKDWKTISSVSGDAGTIMRKAIQDVVTEALKLGLTLPESMRPIVQALIDAGGLTDEFGNKLEDTSRLNFATPIADKIDELLDKLGDLIDAFSKVGTAAEEGFGRARGAAEATGRAIPRGSAGSSNGDGSDTGDAPSRGATGGRVTGGRIIPFSRGIDNVPALLANNEVIFNPEQQAALGSVIGSALKGMPYRSASMAGLRATGTDSRSAGPAPVTINTTHTHNWTAIDGASVQRFVRSKDFNEEMKSAITNDAYGIRTHLKSVTS